MTTIPDPSRCQNKWCQSGFGNFPTSGNFPELAQCSSYQSMIAQQLRNGGVTGRGVTPCPFGYLEELGSNRITLAPFEGKTFIDKGPSSIYFEPNRPTYLPPTGNVRSLIRIGNEWKN